MCCGSRDLCDTWGKFGACSFLKLLYGNWRWGYGDRALHLRHQDAIVAAGTFDLMTGPRFRIADVLTTLRAGEFQVRHKFLTLSKGLNGAATAGIALFTAPPQARVKPAECKGQLLGCGLQAWDFAFTSRANLFR